MDKNAIAELLELTKSIIEYTGEVDETFIALLEDRNQRFESLQNHKISKDELSTTVDAENEKQQLLQELYQLTKQAESVVKQLKHEAAENIKKIHKSKQTTDIYDHNRGTHTSTVKRNPYQATPDAAFFDKKK